jgi:intracellular proteinase inhibitor BsuPI
MLLYTLALCLPAVLGQMKLELALPDTVQSGQAVTITLRVINQSQEAASLYSQGRPTAFDLVISRPGGTQVWSRLKKAVIVSVLQIRELAPGQVLEFTDSWDQRDDTGRLVPPGDYSVVGILPTDPPDQLRSPPETLHIVP